VKTNEPHTGVSLAQKTRKIIVENLIPAELTGCLPHCTICFMSAVLERQGGRIMKRKQSMGKGSQF
jgi:hypothetical protein